MEAKRGAFQFCDAPYITSAQEIDGDYQAPFFYQQVFDGLENIKNYTFSINAVQDLLDADVAIVETSAVAIAGGIVGPGGLLAGLGIGLSEFLNNTGDRIVIEGTTERVGYCNEMVPPTAVYDATGKYTLTVSANTFYVWVAGLNDETLKNGTQAILEGRKFLSQSTTLMLVGAPSKPVTASVVSRGFRDIYAQNLCLVMIDWGAVARQQVGSKQSIGGMLYYPQVTLLFWAGGYFMATNGLYLSGAGTIVGGIDLTNSEGVLANMNAVTSSGPPIGQPSVFGQIQPNERYDSINVAISGNVATCTGVTWASLAGATGPVQGVFLGPDQLQFTVSADMKTLTAQLPAGWQSDYLVFRTTKGDVYTTRTVI